MSRNTAALFTLLLMTSAFALAVHAQQDTVRVDVRLVNVYATVIDSTGRYVGGLKQSDFEVDEDGKAQKLAHFAQDQDTPISVGIVFDKSGSMSTKLQTATDAVDHFIKTIHADDDIFLMSFDSETHLLQNFTNDRTKLTKALRRIEAGGGTALYDALSEGLGKIGSGQHEKRAILLITDGEDTNSQTAFADVRHQIRTSELLVYALGISSNSSGGRGSGGRFRDSVDMGVLQSFAADSGGRAYLVSDNMIGGKNSQFEKMLSQIAEELRSQYTLAYYPAHGDDGKLHSIHVSTRYGYHVRARQGYVAHAQE
jgi:Ca-activated chloride channel homolog